MHQYHIVYKTINCINQKYYIGIHSTNDIDDGYLGSGNALISAIEKYGRENFKKEILKVCENRDEALSIEMQMVTETLVKDENCYNLRTGGSSGFKYSDEWIKQASERAKKNHHKTINSEKAAEKRAIANKRRADSGEYSTKERREAISKTLLDMGDQISKTVKDHWKNKEHSEWRISRMREAERTIKICPHCGKQMRANLSRHIKAKHG